MSQPQVPHQSESQPATPLKVALTIVTVGIILASSFLIRQWIKDSEPKATRESSMKRSAAVVETIPVKQGNFRPVISGLGLVKPAREIDLKSRVSGEVIEVSPNFLPGAVTKKGETLLRIDQEDLEQTRISRQSDLDRIRADIKIEKGNQNVAKADYQSLEEALPQADRSLILREPQLASLHARERSALAALAQVELDIQRTTIKAPFDAIIQERNTNLGAQIGPNDRLAYLIDSSEFWIEANLPLKTIRHLDFEQSSEKGSRATMFHRKVWLEGQSRQGHVSRLLPDVDEKTRYARVIISVSNPLGNQELPRLILGSLLHVEIEGKELTNVIPVPRPFLRQGNTVWVKNDQKLEIKKVTVAFSDSQNAYIKEGLMDGDHVITTDLSTVVNGLPVRWKDEEPKPMAPSHKRGGPGKGLPDGVAPKGEAKEKPTKVNP